MDVQHRAAADGDLEVLAPEPFTFGRAPRVEFGAGSARHIPEAVARHGRRVLMVTGRRSFAESGHRAWLVAALSESGVDLVGAVAIDGEPSPDDVDDAVAGARGSAVEVVLGIGGGGALDAAKAVAGLLRTGTSIRDHLEGVGPQLPYAGPSVPLVAVPTTAGTGSEATRNAVITERGPEGFKRSFRDERLVAADAIVDPELLAGVPRPLIAANGMDALTQLLEAYVSRRASPVTDALAHSGLAGVAAGLIAWHDDPNGPGAAAARAHMAYAAFLSGVCLANAGLGAVHGLASPLGAFFPIPHGAACGAVLVETVAANILALEDRAPGSTALARYATAGRVLGRLDPSVDDAGAREALIALLGAWAQRLDVPRLGTFGVDAGDVGRIVAGSRGSSMRTNPVELTDAEVAAIIRSSL